MHELFEQDLESIATRLQPAADAFAGRSVMVVGASGYLGQMFVGVLKKLNATFLSSPCEIVAVDSFITGDRVKPQGERVRFIEHDIRERLDPGTQVDFVVHAAGVASPVYYRQFPIETIEVSTLGTRSILELAKEHGARALYFSSSEIYGDPAPANVPTEESYRGNVACLGPRACYDESKRMGETLCYIHARYFDTHVSIVRPFNVFGPGMRENDYRVLPNFAKAIRTSEPLTLYASGRQTRTYCYGVDAMTGFFLALLHGRTGEPYNIGTPGPEISVMQLADLLETLHGERLQRTFIDYPDTYPADEPQRRCPDIEKARRELGYRPQVSIEEGLKRYLSWSLAAHA